MSSRLTILQVVPRLNVGGVERGTVEFALYLQQQGHRSMVVSQGGSLVEQLEQSGVEHFTLQVADKSLTSLATVKPLRRLIVEEGVHIVHARSRVPAWLCYQALKKRKNQTKFITTLHGLHSVNWYSSIMAKADRVIAVSDSAKNYLSNNFSKHLRHEPQVINRGLDEQFRHGHQPDPEWLKALHNQFPQFAEKKNVLLPGRLTAVKGAEHVLPWLKHTFDANLILTAFPDDSNYSHRFHQQLVKMGLANKVLWLGKVSNISDLYAAVDVVVSTNNKPESFGRTVLEALTIGKPVVAFDHGGVSEVMNQLFPQGLVPVADTSELTKKIEEYLLSPPLVPAHQLYKNKEMFEQTLSVYYQALKDD